MNRFTSALVAGTAALTLAGCFGSSSDVAVTHVFNLGTPNIFDPAIPDEADFFIDPNDPDVTTAAAIAFDEVQNGQVIEFGCGWFEINTDLAFSDIDGAIIRGCGKNETVLSFAGSPGGNGILVQNAEGILIQGLTVVDTPDDGIRAENSDGVTMRDVRSIWSRESDPITEANYTTAIHVDCPAHGEEATYITDAAQSGKYGLYPTDSRNVLMEDSEAIGAWDAGLYIGQSEDVILRNNRAAFNVAGIEIENTNRADAYNNVSECNTAGLMIFNLPGRPFYGDQVRATDNLLRNNNNENFASSGFIQNLPPGLGLMVMAKDQVEARDNLIEDNNTTGVIIVSHQLLDETGVDSAGMNDLQLNPWPDAVNISGNAFSNNGNDPDTDNLLALLLVTANDGQGGAHIIWDGFIDEVNPACAAPTEVDHFDARGKPQYRNDPDPACRYNAYKFDGAGERVKPDFWICAENNTFEAQDAPNFFNVANSLEFDEDGNIIGVSGDPDNDASPHSCQAQFGSTLPLARPAR